MFSSGRLQIRSWMVMYVALFAAMVLAGRPAGTEPTNTMSSPDLTMLVDSPLLRRDI